MFLEKLIPHFIAQNLEEEDRLEKGKWNRVATWKSNQEWGWLENIVLTHHTQRWS